MTNTATLPLNCRYYTVNDSYTLSGGSSSYAAGQLSVVKTMDEDMNVSYSFTDKLGHLVLTRQMQGSEPHDTYYVYDEKGNLCFVLQPMYQNSANLDLYAFSTNTMVATAASIKSFQVPNTSHIFTITLIV